VLLDKEAVRILSHVFLDVFLFVSCYQEKGLFNIIVR